MIRGTERKKVDILVQAAIYVYLLNALCKYFLPSTVTKLLPISAVILAALRTPDSFKIKVERIDKLFFVFLFVWFLGCLYSPAILKGLGYVLSFALALFFGIYIGRKNLNEKNIIRFLLISCAIMTAFLIIQPFAPDVVNGVTKLFSYSSEQYYLMNAWAKAGMYTGLFPDRAATAFFCCVLVDTGLYYLYQNGITRTTCWQSLLGILAIIMGIYGGLLTAKRGLFLAMFVAVFITYVVYRKSKGVPIWKICLAVAILAVVVGILLWNATVSRVILQRFFESDDLLNGRGDIYSNIYVNIASSPIFGRGTASAFSLLGIGGHNIYLTVLMENGIIGLLSFLAAILYCLYRTIAVAMRFGKSNCLERIPFLLFSLFVQVFFLVYGLSGNPLYDNYILYFYLLAVFITKNCTFHFYKENDEER